MCLEDAVKKTLQLANNTTVISDAAYKNLLDNCFSVLSGGDEIHGDGSILGSKPDLVKQLYSNVLKATVQFVRTGLSGGEVQQYLLKNCNLSQKRSEIYSNLYAISRESVEVSLLNIGVHPPHITNLDWKIDFIVKSSSLDQFGGPLFRIGFTMEKFDCETQCKKTEQLNFTCNSQELQDLVYKLKDAVRHCEKLAFDT